MANGLNKAMLIGNLGADPELRHTQNGGAVLNMRLAVNERWKDQSGETKERVEWVSVVLFGKRAEALGKFLSKGTQLYVEGRLQTRQWEDKNGNKRSTTEVVANEILLLGGKRDGGGRTQRQEPTTNDGPPDDFGDDDIPF